MTRLSIIHKTAYKYNKRVTLSYNEARMTPLTDLFVHRGDRHDHHRARLHVSHQERKQHRRSGHLRDKHDVNRKLLARRRKSCRQRHPKHRQRQREQLNDEPEKQRPGGGFFYWRQYSGG